MNKGELVDTLAKETNSTKSEADRHLNALLDIIEKTLKKGQEVNITGFGKFVVNKRKARQGVNPATGEKIKIAASKAPGFKSGKALKDSINGKKK